MTTSRRDFLATSLAVGAAACALPGAALARRLAPPAGEPGAAPAAAPVAPEPWFTISLAQWSLHRTLHSGGMTNLDFPRVAREQFAIDAVEYVNSFFKDKADDEAYLRDLKARCTDHGVRSLLIMCDGEGALGDPDDARRTRAVKNHHRWARAAKFLGCHSIRVNAESRGTPDDQERLAADGLRALTEYCATLDLNCIVENHGGLSSHGDWLARVMRRVDHPRCGTLPDFGNFYEYDRYTGVREMMPFAKGVSAKSHAFNERGDETRTDYARMLRIVYDAGYRGAIGVEYEGDKHPEAEGIRLTRDLLERYRRTPPPPLPPDEPAKPEPPAKSPTTTPAGG